MGNKIIFRFDKKLSREVYNKRSKRMIDDIDSVAPSPFYYDYTIDYKEKMNEIYGDYMVALNKKSISREAFITKSQSLSFIQTKLGKPACNLLGVIELKLQYNTNFVIVTEQDFVEFAGYSKPVFYEALKELVANHILALTNKRSFYIINHNLLFKGELAKFIANYKDKYVTAVPLDEHGKVIIR